MAISFDPIDPPLTPGGEIKFQNVAGAPPEGVVCSLPNGWTARQRSLVFRLKLSKSGATINEVTIDSVLYRQNAADGGESEGADAPPAPNAPNQPPAPNEQAAPALLAQAPPEMAMSFRVGVHSARPHAHLPRRDACIPGRLRLAYDLQK